jgi:hypothetical protein
MSKPVFKFARYRSNYGLRVIEKGTAVLATDEMVVKHPDSGLWSDEPVLVASSTPRGSVEQATAAPGEKRL